MTAETRYRVKGWAQFQHFKDRLPPWVKLYRTLLDDPDWHGLDGDTSKILVMLWLLASEDDTRQGLLPPLRKLAFRLRITESKTKQTLTKLSHWVAQDDIGTISGRYRDDTPETETETETETDKEETEAERRATRFQLQSAPDEWIDFCQKERPDLNPRKTFDKFHDHWIAKPGKDGTRLDWLATWRNWVRSERAAPRAGPAGSKYAKVVAGLTGKREVDMGDVIDVPARLVG